MDKVVLALKAAVYLLIGQFFNWLFVSSPGWSNYWSWAWVIGWIGMLAACAIAVIVFLIVAIAGIGWWFRTV